MSQGGGRGDLRFKVFQLYSIIFIVCTVFIMSVSLSVVQMAEMSHDLSAMSARQRDQNLTKVLTSDQS